MISILINVICIGLIIFLFIKFKRDSNRNNDSKLPNLVATLGVLGTFVGIFIGLMGFDPNSISTSVPELLEGMRTAFFTSIFGMIFSIWMKYIQWIGIKKEKQSDEQEYIEDEVDLFNVMIQEMKTLNSTLVLNQSKMLEQFTNMDDSWNKKQDELTSEIKNLNKNNNEKQEELISEFKEFSNTMAKSNSEALIEALNGVIKDFNNKITEQFGENFKELNKAVGDLLIWQENYKDHIEKTTAQLDTTVKSITEIEESMKNISNESNVLIKTSESLNSTIGLIHENQKEINDNMDILVAVSNKAIELIPNIDRYFDVINKHTSDFMDNFQLSLDKNMEKLEVHIDKLTVDVAQSSAQAFEEMKFSFDKTQGILAEQIKQYLDEFKVVINELHNCIPDVNEHIKSTNERFNNTLASFTSELHNALEFNMKSIQSQVDMIQKSNISATDQIDKALNDSRKRLEDITANVSEEIKTIVEEMEKLFEKKVEQLDQLLEQELTKSLNSLGGQLVTISERFAKDYIPLANKLRDIVEMAEGAI